MDFSLFVPAFIAGVLTFLAPCTLPLVPGYLGFISGGTKAKSAVRGQVFLNAVFYVIGFSLVFITLGTFAGLLGSGFARYKIKIWLSRVGGVFVVFFGLYMTHLFKLPLFGFLQKEKRIDLSLKLRPGKPLSSFIFGATFAFGWTPCIGPILGTVLLLASSSATVGQGTILLGVFSLGLALPFLLIALGIGTAFKYIEKIRRYLDFISFLGGVFLVLMGVLLITNNFATWISSVYRFFGFVNYNKLLNYL